MKLVRANGLTHLCYRLNGLNFRFPFRSAAEAREWAQGKGHLRKGRREPFGVSLRPEDALRRNGR